MKNFLINKVVQHKLIIIQLQIVLEISLFFKSMLNVLL